MDCGDAVRRRISSLLDLIREFLWKELTSLVGSSGGLWGCCDSAAPGDDFAGLGVLGSDLGF